MPGSSKILVIDTATEFVYLSLVIDGTEAGFAYKNDVNNHAVTVMPLLDEILRASGVKLRELTGVVVGIGPGSYTGVRIGVSIAKMIGYLNGIPVSTVSTLALLASGSSEPKIWSFIDARRGNAFMACFEQRDGLLVPTIPDTLENIESFRNRIDSQYSRTVSGKPDAVKILNSRLTSPVGNVHELVPNYLQVTEAERNKGKS